jgi:hypothetical protein
VAGLRIYRADGQPIYPQMAAPAPIDVGRALAADRAVPVDSGPKLRCILSARLVAIADKFDAMTTDRPYRSAMPVEDALSELLRVAGTQLDEHLVRTFVDLVLRGEIVPLDVQARPTDSPRS